MCSHQKQLLKLDNDRHYLYLNECNETVTVVFDDDVEITVERNGKALPLKTKFMF